MAGPEVVDMDKVAADEQARRASPPPFQSAVAGIKGPTADEEAQMRQLMQGVTLENLGDAVNVPAPQGQPAPVPQAPPQTEAPAQAPSAEVPKKFLKPDGTVDEEKLKASSEQLGKAIEKKEKSIDEMLAEYKEKEKQFTELGQKAKQLKETSNPAPVPEPQVIPQVINQNLPPEQIRQQLLALQQNDPIAFAVEIARVVARKEAAEIAMPALEVTGKLAEQQRDQQMRANLVSLAEKDPRIQDPAYYAEFISELNSDPNYYRLKNPQKAAWNEVKERLRLGEPTGSAHPSQTSGPILGRGAPPSVSSLPQPVTPQTLNEQVRTLNPFSDDGKKIEETLLRQMAEQTWRG